MKITVDQLVAAFGRQCLGVQWLPPEAPTPQTVGTISLEKIVEAVNAIPLVAAAPDVETCEAVGIKPDGSAVALGPIPLPTSMKIKEIARSMWGGDPDDDMSDASLGVGAMEELLNWLKEQGRLK